MNVVENVEPGQHVTVYAIKTSIYNMSEWVSE